MDNERRFPLVLSGFWLKVIALLTMTIDHVGYLFEMNYMFSEAALILRYIGRLALPLFCFMIAEGAIHTKSFNKYALRLGIMASAISLGILFSEVIPFFKNNNLSMAGEGVIFIDLLLGAVAIYLLRQKKWYIKLLAILPLGYGITSSIVTSYECVGCGNTVYWFPFFIRTQYGWYGIALILGFYLAHFVTSGLLKLASDTTKIPLESYQGSNFERNTLNISSTCILVLITGIYYLIGVFSYAKYDYTIQFYAIFAGVFILLYNGLRGYNKKWFQYGSYLYYVLHLPIVYLFVYLLSLI